MDNKELYTNLGNTLLKMECQLREEILLHNLLQSYEISHPEYCGNKDIEAIKLLGEIRKGVYFVVMDLCVSLRGQLISKNKLECNFHIKNISSIVSEGYKFLYNFQKSRKSSYWVKLREYLIHINNASLLEEYATITSMLDAFEQHIDKSLRDFTLHYDDYMVKVFDATVKVSEGNEAIDRLKGFLDLLIRLLSFTGRIQNLILESSGINNNITLGTTSISSTYNSSPLLAIFAEQINKSNQLVPILEKGITSSADQMDMFKQEDTKFVRLEDYIHTNFSGMVVPEEFESVKLIMNIHLLVRFMVSDLSCLLRQFLLAETEIERKLITRRLLVAKTSFNVHMFGYSDIEKAKALWPRIKTLIPNNQESLQMKSNEIETLALKLVHDDDKSTRALYVHLAENGTQKSNILELTKAIDDQRLLFHLIETLPSVQLYSLLQVFLKKMMNALAEQAHIKKQESTQKTLELIDSIAENIKKFPVPEEIKQQILESLYKSKKIF